jgi:pimeloyl-ACP methyl ester carboxylesterase
VVLVASAARLDVPEELLRLLRDELPAGDESHVETMPAALGDLAFSAATHRDLRARWQAVVMQAPRKVVLDDFALCRGLDLRGQLDKLQVPTLVLGGADDLLVSTEQLAETQRAIAGAELELISGAGHMVMLEQPAAFAARLKQFLAAIP